MEQMKPQYRGEVLVVFKGEDKGVADVRVADMRGERARQMWEQSCAFKGLSR